MKKGQTKRVWTPYRVVFEYNKIPSEKSEGILFCIIKSAIICFL